jgi:DNA adenine methylase
MGGVFLRRRVRPSVEVINDISGDIVTLFRVLQRFPDALLRELRWRPAMRSEFARLNETQDCDLLDIERAARFLYLQTLAFGGKMAGRSFGVSTKGAHNFDLTRLEPRLKRLHDRLAVVVIENLDWLDVIARYDRPEIRDLFAWADIEAVQTTYTIAGGDKASTAAELLIGNGVRLAPAAAQASLF